MLNPMPTTGSPVSSTPVQPYCGAVGVNHGLTALFTNGSSPHSEISCESAWMSRIQKPPVFGSFELPKVPGAVYAAKANVCSDVEPLFECTLPVPSPCGCPAPW